ncbi:MAG TPA: uracil-DNA glycosylase [Anaerolineae bacterium]|jgi:DNA polymerase|nr:uracil-DNA glycosylase [Anaerolineae bacterium]
MQGDGLPAGPHFQNLPELFAALEGLEGDPLAAHGTRIVISRGDPAARLMLIGEAPGAEEDRLGQPFVGKSGQLLDQILRSVDLDPARDVFVTNAVYRRPPDNRKPTPEELAWYRPYLLEMVRLIDPRIILLVGGVAALALLTEKRGITQIRGQWFDWNGRRVMPIFHPAYLLRNPSRTPGSPKALTWLDIQEVRRAFDHLRVGDAADAT